MDGGIDDVLHKPVGVGGGTGFPEEIDPVVDLQAGDGEGRAGGAVMVREDGFLFVVEGAGFHAVVEEKGVAVEGRGIAGAQLDRKSVV